MTTQNSKNPTIEVKKLETSKKEKDLQSFNFENLAKLAEKEKLQTIEKKSSLNGKTDIYDWSSEKYKELLSKRNKADSAFRQQARDKFFVCISNLNSFAKKGNKVAFEEEKKNLQIVLNTYYQKKKLSKDSKLEDYRNNFSEGAKGQMEKTQYKFFFDHVVKTF